MGARLWLFCEVARLAGRRIGFRRSIWRIRDGAETARIRWNSLNESLPEDHPARIKLGHFDFAARIIGTSKGANAAEIRAANEQARKYTGWPAFVTMYDADTKPKLVDDCIEAWVANVRFPDVGHADFWRIRPDGYFSNSVVIRKARQTNKDGSRHRENPSRLRCRSGVSANSY